MFPTLRRCRRCDCALYRLAVVSAASLFFLLLREVESSAWTLSLFHHPLPHVQRGWSTRAQHPTPNIASSFIPRIKAQQRTCLITAGQRRNAVALGAISEGGDDDDNSTYESIRSCTSSTTRRRRPPLRKPIRPPGSSSLAKERSEQRKKLEEARKRRHEEALKDPTLLTSIKFSDRRDIHPASKRALTEILGLQQMSQIQAETWASGALEGKSVLGRARTGTGKTLAFLLPCIERLSQASNLSLYRPGVNVGILVLVPTRELAIQIAEQAAALLTFHNTDEWNVLSIYGGTGIRRERAVLDKMIPTILVATPGRLLDHLEGTRIRGRKFSQFVSETRLVVLDETDRLLESFRAETNKILSYLPRPEKRQTLLFSATIPKRLKAQLEDLLPPDHVLVDCVAGSDDDHDDDDDDDDDTDTNLRAQTNRRVVQSYYVLPSMDAYVQVLASIVIRSTEKEQEEDPLRGYNKLLVFLPTTRLVKFFARFFNDGLGIPALEMHSKISQSARNRVRSKFIKTRKRAVLLTSDVSARGVDYPDVSLVVQYGAPSSEETYIHRLGRTGRAGKEGNGLLVLMPFEASFLDRINKNNVRKTNHRGSSSRSLLWEENELTAPLDDPGPIDDARMLVRNGHSSVLGCNAEAAFQSFVAYYLGQKNKGDQDREDMVAWAEGFARSTGLTEAPALSESLALILET